MPLQQTTNIFTFVQIPLYCYIRQKCPIQLTVAFGWNLFDVKEYT